MYVHKKTFFTARDLEEKNDIASHITFAERLVYKYKYDGAVKDKFLAQINTLKEKSLDDKLNLSVVGEFSTGKSTFINALLKCELLVTSAMQGTTSASTVIEYGDGYNMSLVYADATEDHTFNTLSELAEKLAAFSTDDEKAKNLSKILVYLPSENLKSGIRIIDTPGTNALEMWHEDVTRKTIKDFSDLSIVLVDATKPLPESLCLFVEDNLAAVLDRCIFVVTKLDLVREKERQMVLDYVKIKLEETFDITDPIVLPYVSLSVENYVKSGEQDEFYAMSEKTEKRMLKHLGMQRVKNESENVIMLIEELYRSIREQIDVILKACEDELGDILESKNEDLIEFVEKQKEERIQSFDNVAKKNRAEFLNEVYKISFLNQNLIVESIDNASDRDELKSYVASQLEIDCVKNAGAILNHADGMYYAAEEWFEAEVDIFREAFEQKYDSLKVPVIALSEKNCRLQRVEFNKESEAIASAAKAIAQEIEKEQNASKGSRFLGTLANIHKETHSAIDLAQQKNNAKMKLGESLSEYFGDMVQLAIDAFDGYIANARECIVSGIDKYIESYKDEARKSVGTDEGRQLIWESRVENINLDIEDMERRKTALNELNKQMIKALREE